MLNTPDKKALNKLRLILKIGQPMNRWRKQFKNSKQRLNILRQWQDTEGSYIQDLKIIENDIQKPLSQAKLITEEQERLLFPNLKAMIDLSLNMHACIELAIKSWHPHTTMIGESIMHFHKFFMIYREYCNNFMKGLEILKSLKTNPQVEKIFVKLKLDCESYTIKPVQRPPKYQLLLRQYYKALPKNHLDYLIVGSAIQKYHQVNELNNQSMDRQFRADNMIKLQKKFGGIISDRTGRQFLREFMCHCIDFRCQIYGFNDMLLLVRKNKDDSEQIYKRIYLDETCFVAQKQQLKHYKNTVFICGTNQSAHIQFDTPADATYFFEQIDHILKKIIEKQWERLLRFNESEMKRKNMAKFKVSKWYEQSSFSVQFKPKLQITVEGTVKCKEQPMFSVRFQAIYPYTLSQTLLLSMNDLIKVQYYLLSQFKDHHFPRVDEKPEHIGFMETSKNKTKIIEYRSFVIEEFLNNIFRNQIFYKGWRHISRQLGMSTSFFEFVTSEQFTCNCQFCMNLKENQSVSYYESLIDSIKQIKKDKSSSLSYQQSIQSEQPARQSYYSQSAGQVVICKSVCAIYLLRIMHNIKKAKKESITSLNQCMLCLEAQQGNINFSLLIDDNLTKLEEPISLRIQLLTVEMEYIEITLKEDRYVREIIEEFGMKNTVENVYDWGLFLFEEGEMLQIRGDQKLIVFATKWGVEIQKVEKQKEEESFVLHRMIGDLKKWGQQFLGGRKARLFLKKYLYFEPSFQMAWCRANKERYHFLINQQFGRVKYEQLQLSRPQLLSLCSFYLLINELEKIKYSIDHFSFATVKNLLHEKDWPLVEDERFKGELLGQVKKNYDELAEFENQRNGIEFIYVKILELLQESKEWITRYFAMTSYKSSNQKDVLIGVSHQHLIVHRAQDRRVLLSIELPKLQYKVTTFSLFLQEAGIEYRYDGNNLWKLRELIETYRVYNDLFIR